MGSGAPCKLVPREDPKGNWGQVREHLRGHFTLTCPRALSWTSRLRTLSLPGHVQVSGL